MFASVEFLNSKPKQGTYVTHFASPVSYTYT